MDTLRPVDGPSRRRPSPATARLHFGLGRALSWWGWKAGAADAFRDAVRADPVLRDAHFRLGEALARRGHWEEAGAAFAEACRLQPTSVEACGHHAVALARTGQWKAAAAALRRLADLRPGQAEVHLLLGAALRRAGDTTEAIRAFRWAVRLERTPVGRRFFLGEAMLGVRGWGDLEDAFRRARGLPPAGPRPLPQCLRGSPLNAHPGVPVGGPPALAPAPSWLVRFRARVKPRPDVVAAAARLRLRATLGVLLVLGVGTAGAEQREAVAQARVCFSAAGPAEIASCRAALRLGLSPAREALVEVTLANALAALGRWDEVIAVYREAVRRRPADGLAQLRLGLALVHGVDRPAEAEGALREAVRLRPADAEAWAGLGGALALLGRSEEAVAAFEAALAREAGHLDGRPAARALYEAAQKRVRWPPEREERP